MPRPRVSMSELNALADDRLQHSRPSSYRNRTKKERDRDKKTACQLKRLATKAKKDLRQARGYEEAKRKADKDGVDKVFTGRVTKSKSKSKSKSKKNTSKKNPAAIEEDTVIENFGIDVEKPSPFENYPHEQLSDSGSHYEDTPEYPADTSKVIEATCLSENSESRSTDFMPKKTLAYIEIITPTKPRTPQKPEISPLTSPASSIQALGSHTSIDALTQFEDVVSALPSIDTTPQLPGSSHNINDSERYTERPSHESSPTRKGFDQVKENAHDDDFKIFQSSIDEDDTAPIDISAPSTQPLAGDLTLLSPISDDSQSAPLSEHKPTSTAAEHSSPDCFSEKITCTGTRHEAAALINMDEQPSRTTFYNTVNADAEVTPDPRDTTVPTENLQDVNTPIASQEDTILLKHNRKAKIIPIEYLQARIPSPQLPEPGPEYQKAQRANTTITGQIPQAARDTTDSHILPNIGIIKAELTEVDFGVYLAAWNAWYCGGITMSRFEFAVHDILSSSNASSAHRNVVEGLVEVERKLRVEVPGAHGGIVRSKADNITGTAGLSDIVEIMEVNMPISGAKG